APPAGPHPPPPAPAPAQPRARSATAPPTPTSPSPTRSDQTRAHAFHGSRCTSSFLARALPPPPGEDRVEGSVVPAAPCAVTFCPATTCSSRRAPAAARRAPLVGRPVPKAVSGGDGAACRAANPLSPRLWRAPPPP